MPLYCDMLRDEFSEVTLHVPGWTPIGTRIAVPTSTAGPAKSTVSFDAASVALGSLSARVSVSIAHPMRRGKAVERKAGRRFFMSVLGIPVITILLISRACKSHWIVMLPSAS